MITPILHLFCFCHTNFNLSCRLYFVRLYSTTSDTAVGCNMLCVQLLFLGFFLHSIFWGLTGSSEVISLCPLEHSKHQTNEEEKQNE
jgi:hypothetical protein